MLVPPADAGAQAGAELAGRPVVSVAEEVRRGREALHWSQAEVARQSGVSRTVVCEIEAGRRIPSLRTYERLRAALGLEQPAAVLAPPCPRVTLGDEYLTRLAAALLSGHTCSLATLAEGLGVAIPAIREGVVAIADRLARVGLRTFDDGLTVHVAPLPGCDEAVRAVSEVEDVDTLSDAALAVLMIICVRGEPRRRDIEDWHGEGCASLLDRLRRRGFVEVLGNPVPGATHRYRITPKVLGAAGYPTIEAFRNFCLSVGTVPDLQGPAA
jgi:chromosome segregation and condensation protein ScpB/DNA-binding XRE family transcriptional regulator